MNLTSEQLNALESVYATQDTLQIEYYKGYFPRIRHTSIDEIPVYRDLLSLGLIYVENEGFPARLTIKGVTVLLEMREKTIANLQQVVVAQVNKINELSAAPEDTVLTPKLREKLESHLGSVQVGKSAVVYLRNSGEPVIELIYGKAGFIDFEVQRAREVIADLTQGLILAEAYLKATTHDQNSKTEE